jgi:hypothetical protein
MKFSFFLFKRSQKNSPTTSSSSDEISGETLTATRLKIGVGQPKLRAFNDDMADEAGIKSKDHSAMCLLSNTTNDTDNVLRGEHDSNAVRLRCPSMTSHLSSRSVSEKCPFRHGTVYADPYPGYVHGNPRRGICPNGCRPAMTIDLTDLEKSPREVLLREAVEFIQLYYHERNDEMQGTDGFLPHEERISAIKESIYTTGTYVHTFDELQHGARVAWRNAPKCSNRKYWQQLKLLDQRTVTSNKEMFDSCIDHLSKAVSDLEVFQLCDRILVSSLILYSMHRCPLA